MTEDLVLPPGRGIPDGLVVPATELAERFSRSSGPGGQGVNTTDSRVELRWDIGRSAALSDAQRAQILDRLGVRACDGVITMVASEHRSQLQNRAAARARLVLLLRNALAPPPATRRPTRPSAPRRGQTPSRRSEGVAAPPTDRVVVTDSCRPSPQCMQRRDGT
jgi:ribosome-associated protein